MRYLLTSIILIAAAPPCVVLAGDGRAENCVEQYMKNMNYFGSYKCNFIRKKGSGIVNPETFEVSFKAFTSGRCRFAIHGEYEAYDLDGDFEIGQAKSRPMSGDPTRGIIEVKGFASEKSIRGTNSFGEWHRGLEQLSLTRSESIHPEPHFNVPLELEFGHRLIRGPAWMLNTAKYKVVYLGKEKRLGKNCERIRFENPEPNRTNKEVWFSVEEGYLPIVQDTYNGTKLVQRLVVNKTSQVNSAAWYPSLITMYMPDLPSGQIWQVETTELVVPYKPTESELAITLPAGTVVFDPDTGNSFKLRQDERLSGKDLPELFEKAKQAREAEGKPLDTAIRHKSWWSDFWFWLCGCLGLLLVAFGGYRWLRSRRPRTA